MSGIVGIVNRDDAPCDELLVRKLTDFLAFRGPDAQTVWIEGQAALGHTLLRTTPETTDEQQPCSLDGRAWITADVRLDDREALRLRLAEHGLLLLESTSDAKLILGAHSLWGEECLQYLAGDFCFAIWDRQKRRLFCARDQLGVRPFFYAQPGNALVFSNTLACLGLHPNVGRELDERFIGDYLIYDSCADPERTVFSDQHRLPAAHFLTWDAGGVRIRRYWALPAEHPVLRLAHPRDYVEEFRRLLRLAIRDRLRLPKAAVFMSGGLDSTTVAAAAKAHLKETFADGALQAHVMTYARIIHDEEHVWTPRAAEGIGVPLDDLELDDYEPYFGWQNQGGQTPAGAEKLFRRAGLLPEPTIYPLAHAQRDSERRAAAHARVALTGLGPEVAMAMPPNYFMNLFLKGYFRQLSKEIGGYWWNYGRRPPLGLRWLLTSSWRARDAESTYPKWLNESFAKRLDLRNRYRELNTVPAAGHATRPQAHHRLTDPIWPIIFESRDAGVTGVPLDVCYPFFDLRMIAFLISLPCIPWCINKEILRSAGRGVLPEAVRTRPKSYLPLDPVLLAFRQLDPGALARYTLPEALDPFIRCQVVPGLAEICSKAGSGEPWTSYRPYSFGYWIQQQDGPLTTPRGTAQ